jgi:hypothetical protein
MDLTQTTGLLIIKEGQVVAERYQYGRQPGMPMRSFSMAKTFTAMLVGIAHDKGLIRSLDDRAANYWPEIAASAYGQTTIRNLLRMASGVPFRELYTWTPDDDNWVWGMVLYHPSNARQPRRIEQHLLARTQRAGQVDDGVALDGHTQALQFIQHLQGQGPGAGTELPHLARAGGGQGLGHLRGQQLAKHGGQLGRGHEIAAGIGHGPELGGVVGVIAQPRGVQGQGHETVKAQPATGLGNGLIDVRTQGAH